MCRIKHHFFNIFRAISFFITSTTKKNIFVAQGLQTRGFAGNDTTTHLPPLARRSWRTARGYPWGKRKAQRGAVSLNSYGGENGGQGNDEHINKAHSADFISDQPIEEEKEDILGRGKFVNHLSNALLGWKKPKSIVIALCGKWGSGKSSIINLTVNNIKEKAGEDSPTIIEFNPWEFSEKGNLINHFFNEIAKGLKINNNDKDKEIARKLYLYAKSLELISFSVTSLTNWLSKFFIVFGLSGFGIVGSSYILPDWLEKTLFVISVIFIIIGFMKEKLISLANFLEAKREFLSKSASEIKNEIIKQLEERKKKILIVIDNIDRLDHSEIRKIFQLIKANAEFPNTVYLLAFDKAVVTESLKEQSEESGKNYMDKIVQLDFDVPVVNNSKILDYFTEQLKKIWAKLPEESAKRYSIENSPHWLGVSRGGINDFLVSIRDVKRFVNSLNFNLLQMHQNEVMEVNPIDFIAIDAIRIFAPNFYSFMKHRKTLFVPIIGEQKSAEARAEEIKSAIEKFVSDEFKKPTLNIIKTLFPQTYEYSNHTENSVARMSSNWRKELRVCVKDTFDVYFTLIPGEGEDQLSQFEIEGILKSASSVETFEKILTKYIKEDNIMKAMDRFGDFIHDEEMLPSENIKNIVRAFFNVSDDLNDPSPDTLHKWAISHYTMPSILYLLLRREKIKEKNLEVLKEASLSSKGLFGPIEQILLESARNSEDSSIPENGIEILKKIIIERAQNFGDDNLLDNKKLPYIMRNWQDWDEEKTWQGFIKNIKEDDNKLLSFIDKHTVKRLSYSGYSSHEERIFSYEGLSKFLNLEEVKSRLEKIKVQKPSLYENHKEIIDLYLNNWGQKDNNSFDQKGND